MVMQVEAFCCGCALRTGVLVAGIFHTVFGLVVTISYSVTAASTSDCTTDTYFLLTTSSVAAAGVGFVQLVTGALLTYAAAKNVGQNSKNIINLWLITNSVLVAVYVSILACLLIVAAEMQNAWLTIRPLVGCVALGLMLYFLVVVNSYKKSTCDTGLILSHGADSAGGLASSHVVVAAAAVVQNPRVDPRTFADRAAPPAYTDQYFARAAEYPPYYQQRQ